MFGTLVQGVAEGFVLLMTPQNLILLSVGTLAGLIVGALPGMGGSLVITLLLPATFGMRADSAIMLLIAIYAGSTYAGSIGGILYNIPGTASGTATTEEGYPMTQKGEASKALSADILASSIGGNIGWFFLIIGAPILASFALRFGPPEFFMLAVFGLFIIGFIARGSMIKTLMSGCIGLLLHSIGMDGIAGYPRLTFGLYELWDGIGVIIGIIGIYAFSQVFFLIAKDNIQQKVTGEVEIGKWDFFGILRILAGMKRLILKSSIIGTFIGAIPGAGGSVGAWVAYNEAKRSSKHPEKFGTGSMEGIVAAESANNAVIGGGLIPLLTLGIPGSGVLAILIGALQIVGLTPGPRLFVEQAPVVYSIMLSLFITNILFVIYGFTIVRFLSKFILDVPLNIMIPIITSLATIGAYAVGQAYSSVLIAFVLGCFCYVLRKFGFSMPAILLGIILGPMAETNLHRSLMLSDGSPLIFVTRPICLIIILLILLSLYSNIKNSRRVAKSS